MISTQRIDALLDDSGMYGGERFGSPQEVRQYFTRESFTVMFGPELDQETPFPSAREFELMTDLVLRRKLHCDF
ncbi:MAG: hypothetical protein V1798_00795 [Pseudomonadota bacterium]